MRRRVLCIFDFDHTIVDLNTDTYIWNLLPNREKSLPDYFTGEPHWNKFMRKTLQHYYHIGISPNAIRDCLQTMELTPGMPELFTHLKAHSDHIDCAIVSDSNTYFIQAILEKQGLLGLFSKVLTNPAEIIDNMEIDLKPFHSHQCPTPSCPQNQCKRVAIQESFDFTQYAQVCYFGDGTNDYCAGKALREQDTIFVRAGFALEKMVTKQPLLCKTVLWKSGIECIDHLE